MAHTRTARSVAERPATKPSPKASARGRTRPAATLPRIIGTDADIQDGVRALRRKCPIMRRVHDAAGHPPLRLRPAGFEGLARVIVGQQLSVASAAAIWTRTSQLCQPFEPGALLSLRDAQLAAAGLSRPKIRTLRAVSEACVSGLDLAALDSAPDADIHTALTAIVGIGPWTADVYIMFCLGRADAWAPGDLALQIAAQRALGLSERPDADELKELGERWRPWRGVAARLLWAYYAVLKQQGKGAAIPV